MGNIFYLSGLEYKWGHPDVAKTHQVSDVKSPWYQGNAANLGYCGCLRSAENKASWMQLSADPAVPGVFFLWIFTEDQSLEATSIYLLINQNNIAQRVNPLQLRFYKLHWTCLGQLLCSFLPGFLAQKYCPNISLWRPWVHCAEDDTRQHISLCEFSFSSLGPTFFTSFTWSHIPFEARKCGASTHTRQW